MKKNLALKIKSQEEADFCGQILKKIGISPFDPFCFRFGVSRNYLFIENGRYFFAYKQVVDNAIGRGNITLVNSWRKFILNYLSNFYYLCKSKEEKEKLINIICENGLNKKSYFTFPINMDYRYLVEWWDSLVFNDRKLEHEEEINLDNLTLLINSVGQFKNIMQTENSFSKTNKTIKNTVLHLKDKKEKAAAKVYLEGFFKENDLDIKFCSSSFAPDRNDCIYFECLEIVRSYTISSWSDYHKPDKYVNTLGFAELEEFAQLIKEGKKKEKTFTFQNGLVAKYNANNGFIIIGCKEKDLEFWRKFTNQIVELNENFSMSNYSFAVSEIRGFKKWLENL